MNLESILQILQVGVTGFSFLLALLTFGLLTKEQKNQAPRDNILRSIFWYMIFSILLSVVGLISYFLPSSARLQQQLAEQIQQNERLGNNITSMAFRNKELAGFDARLLFGLYCKSGSLHCTEDGAGRRQLSPVEAAVCAQVCMRE